MSFRLLWSALVLLGTTASAASAAPPITYDMSDDATAPVNLVADPGFESGVSDFFGQDASSIVTQTSTSPIEGAHSLHVEINGYGNHVWWPYNFAGGTARQLTVSAHVRFDVTSSSDLEFCALTYYADNTSVQQCTTVNGTAGDKGVLTASVDIDPTRPLDSVNILMSQVGSDPVSFTLDTATAFLDVVSLPPAGGGGDGGSGGGGGGGSAPSCTVASPSNYPGFTYHLPTQRPFISLNDYTQVSHNSEPYARFIQMANNALAGNPDYLYSAMHAVIAYRLTNDQRYLTNAIAMVQQQVDDAEAAIAAGNAPDIAGDSYLDIGNMLGELAITYDAGFDLLSQQQKDSWSAYADQAIFNLWHPDEASWGGTTHTWSGWAICDPGDNYHYSFLRATMWWALAKQDQTLLTFLQTQKFPPLIDYFAKLSGGGTREGTGYGTAVNNLFENYIIWKASTGEDLANLTPHVRETVDYWVNATVPTLDRFAPIGDLSRESIPHIYDYQQNLVHEATVLSAGTPQAGHGEWWLENDSLNNGVSSTFNLQGDLLPHATPAAAPSDLVYQAPGVGALFARTSWDAGATWMATVAGLYDQSHAHHDQGSFTFFKDDWLTVTSNIWSNSGIRQEDEVHNVLRFTNSQGETLAQRQSDTASTMTFTQSGTQVTVTEDLTNAYPDHHNQILNWTRTLDFNTGVLTVHDVCQVAAGVRPTFQLNVPVQPVLQEDGSIVAGHLHVIPQLPVHVTLVDMPALDSDFQIDPDTNRHPFRIDLTIDTGCEFNILLQAQ